VEIVTLKPVFVFSDAGFLLFYTPRPFKIRGMKKEIDTTKAARQHIELEGFLAGFSVKNPSLAEADKSVIEVDETTVKALADLRAEVEGCKQCELWNQRKNAVVGEGNAAAKIVFVGEAPGREEDSQARPFVGRSGQLLDKIIAAMGLERSDVYICNILKCRPPDNRDPKPGEIEKCLPFLKRQLGLIQPEIIVALGAHAAKTLLETNKAIGQLRGKFHEFYFDDSQPPIKLMPTYHPSYLLRNYSQDNRRRVWDDMQKVMAEIGLRMPARG